MKLLSVFFLLFFTISFPAISNGSSKIEYIVESAKNGNADAQFKLAEMYKNGVDIEQDNSQSLFWYEKSAKNGNADAQAIMGLVYYFGVGSYDIDIKRAYAWASVSAKQGRENSNEVAEGYADDLNEQEL